MPDPAIAASPTRDIPPLGGIGEVPADYAHHRRLVTPGDDLRLPRAYLKWYEIRRPDATIPPGLVEESRAFLRDEVAAARLPIDGELGFVLFHLADGPGGPNSVALLIVATWRYANELWRSVYVKDLLGGGDFQPLPSGSHVPTYCVWELAPIWHEQQAWARFLWSARDEDAKLTYVGDRFSGLA